MLVGCGNVGTQAVLLNKNGTFIKTIPGLGGTDELWYDPTTKKFYVTGNNGTNTCSVLRRGRRKRQHFADRQSADDHKCAFDHGRSVQRRCFRAARRHERCSTDAVCPLGCIAVFAPRSARPHRRCWPSGPDRCLRWSFGLGTTASADCLSRARQGAGPLCSAPIRSSSM